MNLCNASLIAFKMNLATASSKHTQFSFVRRAQRVPFHLIHASDHEQAPILMTRAYLKICGDVSNTLSDSKRDWVKALEPKP